ncbi:hypothetical protein BKA59DRAFT_460543 [Fusarium tricinctum]|uniref:Uncharacterized protein n=1 Tax=Fusarium tricinctum TaxID=61284 RepID=A0A8K0W5U3_9HYPO|nr:hypothetical protein BKA59DRAFT_460543 [Fusarium tricinctum]
MQFLGTIEPLSIYITLDTRAKAGEYHWGLILTDAAAIPVLHDASNRVGPWTYRERRGNPAHPLTLIALIRIGDVHSPHAKHASIILPNAIEKQAVNIGLKYASISEAGEGAAVINRLF